MEMITKWVEAVDSCMVTQDGWKVHRLIVHVRLRLERYKIGSFEEYT